MWAKWKDAEVIKCAKMTVEQVDTHHKNLLSKARKAQAKAVFWQKLSHERHKLEKQNDPQQ